MIELTKSQKKKVRELIEKGLARDYLAGVKSVKKVCDSFVEGKSNPKEYYHKLYSTITAKDKDIGRRYDYLTGSKYSTRLLMLLREGVLSEEDLQELDDELKEKLLSLMKVI